MRSSLNCWDFRSTVVSVGPQIEESHLQEKHFREGNIASITCSLMQGEPPVTFNWLKDGTPTTSIPGVKVINHEFSSMLTIMAASRIHAGNYYCKASNPVSWSIMKTRVWVDGTLAYSTFHDSQDLLCLLGDLKIKEIFS